MVLVLLKNGKSVENVYHDLYLNTIDCDFSQIDLVLITEVGIIVFEVKDYNGWLYGKGKQEHWTMICGKNKYRIYSPIIQNEVHIKNLRNIINENQDVPIFSVIVFYGNCNFENINFVPQKTFLTTSNRALEVIKKIEAINPSYGYNNLAEIRHILQEAKANGDITENQELHIANIKDMLGTDRKFD